MMVTYEECRALRQAAVEKRLSEYERIFSLDEARELLPWLQESFDAIRPMLDELNEEKLRVRALLTRLQSNGGPGADRELAETTKSLHRTQEQIDERLYAVTERGILVRRGRERPCRLPLRQGRTRGLPLLAGRGVRHHALARGRQRVRRSAAPMISIRLPCPALRTPSPGGDATPRPSPAGGRLSRRRGR